MTITDSPIDNGVNVQALLEARDTLTGAPEAAEFQWRATCSWVRGTHSHATVEGFSGLGQEHTHRRVFEFDADHPALLRLRGQRRHPGRARARGAGELPDRRRRRGRPDARHPAALGHRHHLAAT